MRPIVWYVAFGSAVGGLSRYVLGAYMQNRVPTTFPIGTLAINLTGSFLLGFLLRYALATPAVSPEVRAMLTTGFCGGYTTFSTFSWETVVLLEEGAYGRVLLYISASVGLAVAGTIGGMGLASTVLRLARAR